MIENHADYCLTKKQEISFKFLETYVYALFM